MQIINYIYTKDIIYDVFMHYLLEVDRHPWQLSRHDRSPGVAVRQRSRTMDKEDDVIPAEAGI